MARAASYARLYPTLAPRIGGTTRLKHIRAQWDELLRLAGSIRQDVVAQPLDLRLAQPHLGDVRVAEPGAGDPPRPAGVRDRRDPAHPPDLSTVYAVDEIVQVPSLGNAQRGVTHEGDGYAPHVRGFFDEQGRLMVVINCNTDIGAAWEWAEAPYYPLVYSTYAYQVAANVFMYAMMH